MFIYNDAYDSIEEFTCSLLSGDHDQMIYDRLHELSNDMDSWRFIKLEPTAYFIFIIEFADEREPFIIDPWAMIHNYRWYPGTSSMEHKIMMLLVAIIRFQHSEISANLKFNKDTECYRQANQKNTKESSHINNRRQKNV